MAKGYVPWPAALRRVHWGQTGELPAYTFVYPEGEVRWYGSGTTVVDVWSGTIMMRHRWGWVDGRPRLAGSWPMAEGDVMALRKIAQATGSKAPGGVLSLEDAVIYPTLVEYLTGDKYPDGEKREKSALIIVAEAQEWKGCVTDKDNGRTLWKSAATVEALLEALEHALAADDPTSWRQAYQAKGGKKRS